MRQEEFLKKLQETLTGRVSERVIQENVSYYLNYINNEIRNGKSEEEVLIGLGDPRLLAKTIEESNKYANGDESYATENSGWNYHGNNNTQGQETSLKKTMNLQGWLALIIIVVILIVIAKVAFSLLKFFAPVILAGAVGLLVYRLITGGGK